MSKTCCAVTVDNWRGSNSCLPCWDRIPHAHSVPLVTHRSVHCRQGTSCNQSLLLLSFLLHSFHTLSHVSWLFITKLYSTYYYNSSLWSTSQLPGCKMAQRRNLCLRKNLFFFGFFSRKIPKIKEKLQMHWPFTTCYLQSFQKNVIKLCFL